MKNPTRLVIFVFFLMVVVSLSGCALLSLPALIIGETFKLIGQVLQIVSRLPKPPPGVF